jgi:superfamily II DNA helicase RecQ
VDELTRSLEALLQEIGELGRGLEDQLALLIEEQRSRSPFAYLMEPSETAE